MVVKEINLEQGYPTVAEAMDSLRGEINIARVNHNKCLIIIHGYGSSGVGGAIRQKARAWLNAQAKANKLKYVIEGEKFGIFDERAREVHDKYKDRLLNQYYGKANDGVTIVVL